MEKSELLEEIRRVLDSSTEDDGTTQDSHDNDRFTRRQLMTSKKWCVDIYISKKWCVDSYMSTREYSGTGIAELMKVYTAT